jgi:nascent polypeptide-associated complex subunit alpha
MMPGMNSRQMQQMMRQMGVQQVDINATQVIILTENKRIVIDNPQVAKVTMMGQQTWQISGPAREEALDVLPDITDDDVDAVMAQTGADEVTARKAILDAEGDLASAIMALKKQS